MDPAIEKARAMRKAMTPPELRLWKSLRRLRAEGRHFRRQTPFRGYFLDFVCHRSRLVVEVDGRMHEHRVEHDRTRDAVLLREGYRTLRFSNEAVRDHLDWVMERIRTELGAGVPHPGSAAPRRPSP
ncbi:endonuclease domain-containing protein [Brevundimonas sp. UBA2416]|uniref:endonuclease domain-containing protein n=1 Tax=Brevundimonas sp. UBA2416 TaxID=1946124 RepID=UPI0025BB5700|nr:endonuclease domain-containing protein [Brevundimonas sp. UBA2416]HRJ64010.1 endonuclease domain-containing protein [Brevundimonas sp.]